MCAAQARWRAGCCAAGGREVFDAPTYTRNTTNTLHNCTRPHRALHHRGGCDPAVQVLARAACGWGWGSGGRVGGSAEEGAARGGGQAVLILGAGRLASRSSPPTAAAPTRPLQLALAPQPLHHHGSALLLAAERHGGARMCRVWAMQGGSRAGPPSAAAAAGIPPPPPALPYAHTLHNDPPNLHQPLAQKGSEQHYCFLVWALLNKVLAWGVRGLGVCV